MASKVVFDLASGQDTATLTLLDPIGPNNTWSCDPADFLSAPSGDWSQGLASAPVVLQDTGSKHVVLQFVALNMYDPAGGPQSGDALCSGEGGTVADQQTVTWGINTVS